MKTTETKHTPLKSVIHAANMLGVLAENQLLPAQIRDIGRKAWENADTDWLMNEHAALIAVAEAAEKLCNAATNFPQNSRLLAELKTNTRKALDSLATIRNQK